MNKLWSILDLFRKGNAVADPEAWKTGGNAVMLLVPAIMAAIKLAGDFGYGVQLTTEEATAIAGGIVTCVQFIIHNVSSDKAGVLPRKSDTTTGETSDGSPRYEGVGERPERG